MAKEDEIYWDDNEFSVVNKMTWEDILRWDIQAYKQALLSNNLEGADDILDSLESELRSYFYDKDKIKMGDNDYLSEITKLNQQFSDVMKRTHPSKIDAQYGAYLKELLKRRFYLLNALMNKLGFYPPRGYHG